jgi:tRNA(Ile)-lysidine synthase
MALDFAAIDSIVRSAGPSIIGVSGGRDSMALLHMLCARNSPGLIIAHLDHQLRHESAADADFVRGSASQYAIPFVTAKVDVGALAAQSRALSMETAAREARYGFFAKVAREHGAARVLLAHHADDQVETVLFNFLRGSGVAGLSGMARQSVRLIDGVEMTIVRPLLETWRAEIDAYVAQHHLDYRDDHSNQDPRHTRNRVRHKLIPLVEEIFGRDVRPAILRMAKMLRAENELLEASMPEAPEELSVAVIKSLPEALQRRLIHRWLKSRDARDVGFDVVERVRALCHETTAKTNLAGNRHVRRRGMKLFIEG